MSAPLYKTGVSCIPTFRSSNFYTSSGIPCLPLKTSDRKYPVAYTTEASSDDIVKCCAGLSVDVDLQLLWVGDLQQPPTTVHEFSHFSDVTSFAYAECDEFVYVNRVDFTFQVSCLSTYRPFLDDGLQFGCDGHDVYQLRPLESPNAIGLLVSLSRYWNQCV